MAHIIETAETILILSGEGEEGTFEKYTGKRTVRALRTALTKARCNGDRWAFALVSADEDHEDDTFIELDGDLEFSGYRTVSEDEYE